MRPCIAFTIGRGYDRYLADGPVSKSGRGDCGRDPDYPGGWVWRTAEEAEAARAVYSLWKGPGFAVYRLGLPDEFEACASLGIDGIYHLAASVPILGRHDDHARRESLLSLDDLQSESRGRHD